MTQGHYHWRTFRQLRFYAELRDAHGIRGRVIKGTKGYVGRCWDPSVCQDAVVTFDSVEEAKSWVERFSGVADENS